MLSFPLLYISSVIRCLSLNSDEDVVYVAQQLSPLLFSSTKLWLLLSIHTKLVLLPATPLWYSVAFMQNVLPVSPHTSTHVRLYTVSLKLRKVLITVSPVVNVFARCSFSSPSF